MVHPPVDGQGCHLRLVVGTRVGEGIDDDEEVSSTVE